MTKPRGKPQEPVLPASVILDTPALAAADALAIGATVLILDAWWRGGCLALPPRETALMVTAKCYQRRWGSVQGTVKRALAELVPKLVIVHDEHVAAAQRRIEKARANAAKSAAVRAARRQLVAPPIARAIHPTHAPRHHNSRVDMQARADAIARTRAVQALSEVALYYDT
jgi:hypothetical protein